MQNANGNSIGETNDIGTGLGPLPLGNGSGGIWLDGATDTLVDPSAVKFNGVFGVAVTGVSATGNKIHFIANFGNGGLPIDLNNDGATPNDAGDGDSGPNTLLNFPVITAFAGQVVSGTACANCTVYVYHAVGNPGAPGGGHWSVTLPAGLDRGDLSATACDSGCGASGNTSEMSPPWQLSLPVMSRH